MLVLAVLQFSEEAFFSTLSNEGAQLPTLTNSFKCLKLNGMNLGLSDWPLAYGSSSDPGGPVTISSFCFHHCLSTSLMQQIFASQKLEQP